MIIRDVAFAIAQFHGEKPETLHQSDVLQSIAEGNEARRQVAEKDALIASQAAEIEKLELCLEPGKAAAIVRAVFDIAEKKCGHNPFSARHGLTTIDEYLDQQAAQIATLTAQAQSMREALRQMDIFFGSMSGGCEPEAEAAISLCRAALAQVSASPVTK